MDGQEGLPKPWTKKIRIEIKDETGWALLRTKTDPRTNEMYFDILAGEIGKKGERKVHTHIGFNLNETRRFFVNRGIVAATERTLSQSGIILDNKKVRHLPYSLMGKQLVFRYERLPTMEVTVKEFRFA